MLEQINPPKPPIWRDPKYLKKEGWTRHLLGLFSSVAVAMLLITDIDGLVEPISTQLQRHATLPTAGFFLLMMTVGYLAVRLLQLGMWLGFIVCVLIVGGLAFIDLSDPYSTDHLFVFACIALGSTGIHWYLASLYDDWALRISAAVGSIALVLCFIKLGLGERLLIVSATVGINRIFYDTLVDMTRD